MSVIGFTASEVGEMAGSVTMRQSYREKKEEIYPLFDRLYMGNQMAIYYMYGEGGQIERLTEEDIKQPLWGDKALLAKLESLRYNLYTNNGNCFVGQEDAEKLNRIIERIMKLIIRAIK